MNTGRRYVYPTPSQCAWTSATLLLAITANDVTDELSSWNSPFPMRVVSILAIITGVGYFLTGPLTEALRLGRSIERTDSRGPASRD